MATMPAASPSSPSMRLIAWLIPSSHSTVISGLESSDRMIDPSIERQPEREHRDAEPDQHEPGDDRAGHLRRRGDLRDVVEQADGEDRRRREQHAERLGVVGEQRVEAAEQPRREERGDEPDEHRDAADVGRGVGVDASGRSGATTQPRRRAATRRRVSSRTSTARGHGSDDEVGAQRRAPVDQPYGVGPDVRVQRGSGRTARRLRLRTTVEHGRVVAAAQGAGDEPGDLGHLRLASSPGW